MLLLLLALALVAPMLGHSNYARLHSNVHLSSAPTAVQSEAADPLALLFVAARISKPALLQHSHGHRCDSPSHQHHRDATPSAAHEQTRCSHPGQPLLVHVLAGGCHRVRLRASPDRRSPVRRGHQITLEGSFLLSSQAASVKYMCEHSACSRNKRE